MFLHWEPSCYILLLISVQHAHLCQLAQSLLKQKSMVALNICGPCCWSFAAIVTQASFDLARSKLAQVSNVCTCCNHISWLQCRHTLKELQKAFKESHSEALLHGSFLHATSQGNYKSRRGGLAQGFNDTNSCHTNSLAKILHGKRVRMPSMLLSPGGFHSGYGVASLVPCDPQERSLTPVAHTSNLCAEPTCWWFTPVLHRGPGF